MIQIAPASAKPFMPPEPGPRPETLEKKKKAAKQSLASDGTQDGTTVEDGFIASAGLQVSAPLRLVSEEATITAAAASLISQLHAHTKAR